MNTQISPDEHATHPLDLTQSEIDAIVSLLADENERTDAKIVSHVLTKSPAARRAVLSQAESAGVWVQMRLAPLLRQEHREELAQKFRALDRDATGEVDLEDAAFLLAQLGVLSFDEAHYRSLLDTWADDVHLAVSEAGKPTATLEALLDVLFRRLGFSGDHDTYYQPQNSFLPHVMDQRTGLPITLSVIVLLVAKRVGVNMAGIGAPGHFLLRHDLLDSEIYIDAFEGGELLTEDDCLKKVAPAQSATAALPAAAPNAIIVRMLQNLAAAYEQAGDAEGIADCQACIEGLLVLMRSTV